MIVRVKYKGGMKNWHCSTSISILKTVQDIAIVTVEDEEELFVCDLLIGAISSDLQ